MSHKKPTPTITQVDTRRCPVCGKRAYSSSGIHPQCAMRRADKLRAEQRAPEPKLKDNQVTQGSWYKKCLQCGAQVHVQRRTCDCGYDFSGK